MTTINPSKVHRGKTDEWYTPKRYVDLAREVMGSIYLDPATNFDQALRLGIPKYYTKEDDGLTQEWNGNVWCNPPYSRMSAWVTKAIAEYESFSAHQIILLTKNATETYWFQKLAYDYPFCLCNHRIKFINESGKLQKQPFYGNVFFYLGRNTMDFLAVFKKIGVVIY